MAEDPHPEHEAPAEGGRSRAEAVRHAVDQAFRGTAGQGAAAAGTGRERAQDLVDQLASAAGRARGVIDDLRPPLGGELRALRERLETLERRVAELERERRGGGGGGAEGGAGRRP